MNEIPLSASSSSGIYARKINPTNIPSSYSASNNNNNNNPFASPPPKGQATSQTNNPTASSSTTSSNETNNNPESFVKGQIRRLRNDLALLMSIPFLFALSFGGNSAIFVFAFGGIACYILDILESVEVRLISLPVFFSSSSHLLSLLGYNYCNDINFNWLSRILNLCSKRILSRIDL